MTDNPTDFTQTASPPPTGSPRRLTKSSDRKIAGVAAGIGEYFGIDPTIVRLLLVVSIFLGGFGLIAYLIAWVVLPSADGAGDLNAPHTLASTSSTVVAFGLLVAGAIVAAATIDFPFGNGVLVPLFLIGTGAFLLLQQPDAPDSTSLPSPPAPSDPTDTIGSADTVDATATTGPIPLPADVPGSALVPRSSSDAVAIDVEPNDPIGTPRLPPPPVAKQPVVPPEPTPPVGALVMSAIAVIAAGGFLVHAAGWTDVNPTVVVGLCLGAIGIGLLAGAAWGGGGGLIPLGILTTAVLLIVAVAGPAFEDGIGDRDFHPATFDDVRAEYRLGIGQMVIDLRDVDFPPGDHAIDAHVGIGELRVILPDDVEVVIDGSLDIGEIEVFEQFESGVGNDIVKSINAEGADAVLSIDIDSGIGHVEVVVAERESS